MTDRIAIEDAIEHYLERKSTVAVDGRAGGAYAAKAEVILHRWARWLDTEQDVRAITGVGETMLEAYAAELRASVDDGTYTASTANTYFAVVRAFLSWCSEIGLLPINPAATERAQRPLPSVSSTDEPATLDEPDASVRRKLVAYVRRRALEATARKHEQRLDRLREYALVSLLAHTGVRGAELFRVPEDGDRTGATWKDVDFYTGTIRVLGRSRRLETVELPADARTPLRRYRVAQNPPTTDWPIFPTHHAPSIARRVRSTLRDRGYDEATVESILAESTAESVAHQRTIAPPAITTEGARSILKRLCTEAGIGDDTYVTPRGFQTASTAATRREADQTADSGLVSPSPDRSIVLVETYRRSVSPRQSERVVDDEVVIDK